MLLDCVFDIGGRRRLLSTSMLLLLVFRQKENLPKLLKHPIIYILTDTRHGNARFFSH